MTGSFSFVDIERSWLVAPLWLREPKADHTMRSTALLALMLLAGLAAQASAQPCHSLYDIISSSRHLTILKDIIDSRGFKDDLSNTNLAVTLFAPTNAAWLDQGLYTTLESWDIFQGQELTAEKLLGSPQVVEYLLENHIVNENVELADLLEQPKLRTLNEVEYLLMDVYETNVTGVDVSCEDKLVTVQSSMSAGSIMFCGLSACGKSTVYVVDVVLLPEQPTAALPMPPVNGKPDRRRALEEQTCTTPYQYIATNNTYSFFKDMVDAAGLTDLLDDPEWEGTVFAPPNAALAGAMTDLGVGLKEFLSQKDVIDAWVRYHIIEGPPLAAGLWKEGSTFLTALNGEALTLVPGSNDPDALSCSNGVALLDSFTKRDAGVQLVQCDVTACKASVHGLDDVLVSSSIEGLLTAFPNHDAARFHDNSADEDWTWQATLTGLPLEDLVQ